MRVESGQIENVNVSNVVKRKTDEERRLREMTIPKKQKRLYDQIKYTQKKKRQEVRCCCCFFLLLMKLLINRLIFRLRN